MNHRANASKGVTFALLRHAYAGSRQDWSGPDDLRPLDPLGLAQAAELSIALGVLRPNRLVSSPALRCLQTLVPLADGLGLAIESNDLLSVQADRNLLLSLIRSLHADGTMLCTHGEVIEDVLDHLAVVPRRPNRFETAKAGCWVISDFFGPSCTVRYIAPGDSGSEPLVHEITPAATMT